MERDPKRSAIAPGCSLGRRQLRDDGKLTALEKSRKRLERSVQEGTVTGSYTIENTQNPTEPFELMYGFIRSPNGVISSFEVPGTYTTVPVDINNLNVVVGWSGFGRAGVGKVPQPSLRSVCHSRVGAGKIAVEGSNGPHASDTTNSVERSTTKQWALHSRPCTEIAD